MQKKFEKQLQNSGYIHIPLSVDYSDSLEAQLENKKILKQQVLWHDGKLEDWSHWGQGGLSIEKAGRTGGSVLCLKAPVVCDEWPEGSAPGGEYSNFGRIRAHLKQNNADWTEYNRISMWIKPDFMGNENVTIIAAIVNDGETKIPDRYHREGYHVINVKNHQWNHVIWEFPDLPREKVTELIFYTFLNGISGVVAEEVVFYVDEIQLETVEQTEHALGWQGGKDVILYAASGYLSGYKKQAITTIKAETFQLIDRDKKIIYTSTIQPMKNEQGEFGIIDFSLIEQESEYEIRVGERETPFFPIGARVLESSVWKTINFLFCERCGYPVPGIHGACHFDCVAEHKGKQIIYNGGWHDAGDMSQQTLQSGEITQALFEMALRTDKASPLYLRLMEEAEWGLDFILRTRYGDGYRVTSAGMTRYTQNQIGDMDDIKARVHNNALDNFMLAGIEAYAAYALKDKDMGRADYCRRIAIADFEFALERYREIGFEKPAISHEHSFTTGPSTFYAMVVLASSNLYRITEEEQYAQAAREFADKMLACQEDGESGLSVKGFFYRDSDKNAIVHFNHQSREQLFMQALEAICLTQPQHAGKTKWENAMQLYGDYIKMIAQYTAPYGMIPAGIYNMNEVEDYGLFCTMNHGSDYDFERKNFKEQIENGIPLGKEHYLRKFPVWFSFRGNCVVSLASAKAATILGRYFKDKELMQIGAEQIYWILGKNPFGQSIMFGEGQRFAQQYATSSGELVGELPVGIESFDNKDTPYWPQGNNCTYKEIWTSPAGRYLWVAADLYE